MPLSADSQNSLIEPLKMSFLFSALAPHSALRTQGASHFLVPLIPLAPCRSPGFSGYTELFTYFTKTCAQGSLRLAECCHDCFHAAGHFQPHSDAIRSMFLWSTSMADHSHAFECLESFCLPQSLILLSELPCASAFSCMHCSLEFYSARLYHTLRTG